MKIVGVILPIKVSARKETKKGNKKTVELNYLPLKAYKIMATNLEVGKYKNIKERTCVAPSLNLCLFPVTEINTRSPNVARSLVEFPVGGYFRNFWVDVPLGPWNPYPIPELVQLNFATLY